MSSSGVTVIQDQVSIPVLTQAVSAAYTTNPIVLFGTEAAIFLPTMPFGGSPNDVRGGDLGRTVEIPYFNPLPPMADLDLDGDKIQPQKITSSGETGTVKHSGLGANVTDWAKRGQLPTYEEAGKQIAVRTYERADLALIATARSSTDWGSYTFDEYSASTPKKFSREGYLKSIGKLGAHGMNRKPALILVHSQVMLDILNTKNANGDPNLVEGGPGGTMLLTPYGIPIAAHDGLSLDVADGALAKYETLILYPRSLIFWMGGVPYIGIQRDESIPSTQIYAHIWWVAHRYKRMDMLPIPGVTRYIHN